jgi:hypothetical protein
MKSNINKDKYQELGAILAEADIAETVCEKALVQIKRAKRELVQEFRGRVAGHESVLRLALNEAEALAWETNFPHLVFATLAMEKAQAAATWETRQQLLNPSRVKSPQRAELRAHNHV